MKLELNKLAQAYEQNKGLDKITLEVIRGALVSLTSEMGIAMERTAYSPIFSVGLDFSCALFDNKAEMIAQAAFDPLHLGAMAFAVEWSLKEIGLENLDPGDTLVHNDPFRGGTHLPDFTMMLPVFAKKEIVAVAALRFHQLDIGGMVPGAMGGEMTESFQEGIRIPPVKLHVRGIENEDVWKILLSNVRVPKAIREDMRSVHGALRLAEKRILHLVNRYSTSTFMKAHEEIKNLSEKMMRDEISTLPEGTYTAEDYLDDDGFSTNPVRIKVKLTIRSREIIADYSGSNKQVEGCINTTYGLTASETYTPILDVLGAHIPTNHGCYRPIRIIAPPRTVVNADYPAATVGGNVETSARIFDTVMAALSQAAPDRVLAACHGTFLNFVGGGVNPETRTPFVWYLYKEGGWGGRPKKDGNSAIMGGAWSNDKNQPVETIESAYPFLVEEYSLNVDQAGAGRFRGGLGTKMTLRMLGDAKISLIGDRFVRPPYGLFGGEEPRRRICGHWNDFRIKLSNHGKPKFRHVTELYDKRSDSKWANILVHKGDVLEYISTGGGGYGNPLERDPQLVHSDVQNGYISISTAKNQYGVVIDPRRVKILEYQTKLRRSSLKKRH